MPSNEKTDGRDKKRYVYRGKSQEDFRKADMEHVTFYTKNYGEFVLSWYMGENTEKPACVADPFAANAAAKKWKKYCDRLARSIGKGGKSLDKEFYTEENIDHELAKVDKTIYKNWYDYTGGEAHNKVCRLKHGKGSDIRKMFKSKYAEQEEQDRIDKLATYTTGDVKGEVGIGAWSDEVNIEDAINFLDQARQEAWVIAKEDTRDADPELGDKKMLEIYQKRMPNIYKPWNDTYQLELRLRAEGPDYKEGDLDAWTSKIEAEYKLMVKKGIIKPKVASNPVFNIKMKGKGGKGIKCWACGFNGHSASSKDCNATEAQKRDLPHKMSSEDYRKQKEASQGRGTKRAAGGDADKDKECRFWKEGKCWHGKNCRFKHIGDVKQQERPSRFPGGNGKDNGKDDLADLKKFKVQLVKKLKAEFASIRKENKEGGEESEFEVSEYFDINMIRVAKTKPKGGIKQVGAIPNGRDKRDETGIDSDAMVSVSGIKEDFVEMYIDEDIANGMQLHGLGGKMCRPPKKGLMMKKVVGYEELDIEREMPIDTFIYDIQGVYMPNAEVNVFSELRLAETGLHVYPDIQNGKLVGKYLKHVDTGLIIPLDLASGIVVVKADPKFDARHLDMDDGAELAELTKQIDELRVDTRSLKDWKTVNNVKKAKVVNNNKANKRDADGNGEEFAKKAKLQSCCEGLVLQKHNSSESLIESNHTQKSSLIESDYTKKSSTVSYCVSNRFFRN